MPTTLKSQPVPEGGQNTSKDGAADQGQKKEPASEKLSPSLDRIEAAIRDLITQERAAQGQGPKDEEIRDLKAQEGMALWAKAMFWATIAAVLLTFAGIVLIRYTLKYTKIAAGHTKEMLNEARETTKAARAAVDEAKEATKAAEDAVVVTRNMGMAQTRAYIAITQMIFYIDPPSKPHFKIEFSNAGHSPTRNIEVRIRFSITEMNVVAPQSYQSGELIHTMADVVPSKDRNRDIPGFDIPGDALDLTRKSVKQLTILTTVKYIDVFDKDREDTFRHIAHYGRDADIKKRQELTPVPRWL